MLIAVVTYELVETMMNGQPIVRVSNSETVQAQGPATGDLGAAVFERLGDDVQGRAVEQVKEVYRQTE